MAMNMGLTAASAEEADIAAVKTIVESVAVLADMRNFEDLETLYADEFLLDYSALNGHAAELRSPRGLMTEWAGVLPGFDRTRHDLANVTASVEGASATASADVTAGHWLGGSYWEASGRYDYRLEKDNGAWRITAMTFLLEDEKGARDIIGPAATNAAEAPPGYIVRQQTEKAVRDFLEGLETFDMDRVNAVWAQDAVQDMPYTPAGFPGRIVGRDNIVALYETWPDAVRNPSLTETLVLYPGADPQIVFAEWNGRAEVVATGRLYEQRYGGLFHVENTKITLYREYFDPRPFAYAFAMAGERDQ